ncbi:MAG TPA: response regulator [Caulobacteraceae bacterium]|jgi:CheY-like chemotaxis protein|nr:response regulator [Caulobacteraceae bacterium]
MSTVAESRPLAGRRLLVVEDEMFVAMLIEDILTDLGCEVVGPAASVAEALRLTAGSAPLDGAVLDVNLGAETVYPVADALQRAQVPYVFVTGYSAASLNEAHRGQPLIQKPFNPDSFAAELAQGLAQG